MSDENDYYGITNPLVLSLLKNLHLQQWLIQEERRIYEEEMALAERVFGEVIRREFGDYRNKQKDTPD